LMDAIGGISNVRVLVARYLAPIPAEQFLAEFNAGVAKAGQFNKIMTDFGFTPGATGLYALPDNAGSIAFAYRPAERTVYAARVVGGVDVPKLIKWVGKTAKTALEQKSEASREREPSAAAEKDTPAAPEPVPEK
jgi:hypothetical protein